MVSGEAKSNFNENSDHSFKNDRKNGIELFSLQLSRQQVDPCHQSKYLNYDVT